MTFPPASLLLKHNDAAEFMFTFLLPVAAFLAGSLERSHREHAAALRERADQLERERAAEAARAAAEERARIARDMHDILAHAVSLMVVQAEAGPVVVRSDPDRAERAFDAIADAGRDAMVQLRRMLGVLKAGEDPRARSPRWLRCPSWSPGTWHWPRVEYRGDGGRVPPGHRGRRLPDRPGGADEHRQARAAPRRSPYGCTGRRRGLGAVDHRRWRRRPRCPSAGTGWSASGSGPRPAAARRQAGPLAGGGFEVRARLPVSGQGCSMTSAWWWPTTRSWCAAGSR